MFGHDSGLLPNTSGFRHGGPKGGGGSSDDPCANPANQGRLEGLEGRGVGPPFEAGALRGLRFCRRGGKANDALSSWLGDWIPQSPKKKQKLNRRRRPRRGLRDAAGSPVGRAHAPGPRTKVVFRFVSAIPRWELGFDRRLSRRFCWGDGPSDFGAESFVEAPPNRNFLGPGPPVRLQV